MAARLVFAAIALFACWLVFLSVLAGRGEAICPSRLSIVSRQAVLNQGVWAYLLHSHVAHLPPGLPGENYAFNPTSRIDPARVRAFLRSNPDCRDVFAPGQGPLNRLYFMIFHPSKIGVHVPLPPRSRLTFNTNYLVDACWPSMKGEE